MHVGLHYLKTLSQQMTQKAKQITDKFYSITKAKCLMQMERDTKGQQNTKKLNSF